MQQVHLRINDAATGQPTPVRLRITDASGTYYAPFGRLTEFATGVNQDVGGNVQIGAKKWCYIDGTCEILLPPGQLHVEISKGFEYKPIDEEVTLLAGKMSLRFTIERWCDMRKQGWYSGDTRVHFMTPDAALLEGQAEDLAVVNLLAQQIVTDDSDGNSINSIPNILSFSGQQFARIADNCGVAVGTFNGNLGLLHTHRVVYPLKIEPESNDWTLADWCGQCHRKKGLVAWRPFLNPRTADLFFTEDLACAILGMIDCCSLNENIRHTQSNRPYYRFANAGVVLPLVGESGKQSNNTTLGAMRTYAYLPPSEDFTFGAWIEALRAGRTFVSNGPVVLFKVNGEVQPSTLSISRTDLPLKVCVEARSPVPFDVLELVWNGEVIATTTPSSAWPHETVLEHEFAPTKSGWIAVRCTMGSDKAAWCAPFAHTSFVVILLDDAPVPVNVEDINALLAELDMLAAGYESAGQHRVLPILKEARTVIGKKLSQ